MSEDVRCSADKIDYIISYRESSKDRKMALLYVVSRLHQQFPKINIIIVEQDNSPKLVDSELPYCQIVFVFNSGLFNRSWANNVGVAHSKQPFLVFGDCDIFMEKAAFQCCLNALQRFEAVDPKRYYIQNVSVPDPNADYQIKDKRFGNTFAGGIFFIRRQSLLAIGRWDEQFEGWGGEDNVMEHAIRLFLRQCRLQLEVYHIDHVRTALDTKLQPRYQVNRERSRSICAVHGIALLEYIEEKKNAKPGEKDKYQNLGTSKK